MRRFQAPLALVCIWSVASGTLLAQTNTAGHDAGVAETAIRVDRPRGGLGWLTRPYQQAYIPPVDITNSSRLDSLIRAGNLYLTADDVIALALENNLDIEIQRYGPLLTRQVTKRAQAGGFLRNVGVGVAQGPQSVSLTGVSLNASGGNTSAAGGVSSGGGIVTQLGPTPPSLDPNVSVLANFAHTTSPESNTILTGTTALIVQSRSYQAQLAQTFSYGLNYQLAYSSTYNKFNSQFFTINPYDSGALDLQVSQPLLQGFGRSVNLRNMYISKNNEKVADLQFKQQVITTISSVLNLYWDLVAFYQDQRSKQRELATAQRLFEDNKKQVEVGTLAPIEVTRAEAQLYQSQQDLLVSQTNLLQQETVLKNALSKNGVANATLADVHIVPLDTIEIPEKDAFASIDDLVKDALGNRVEIQQSHINIDSNRKNLVGIKNGLRPSLNAFFELTNNGLAGTLANPNPAAAALVGGYGTLLSQIFTRDYPSYSAGFSLNIPLRNRAAQADYVTSELELRQTQLQLQKSVNQVRVDVQNAVIGLRQARARYDAAVKSRQLQTQTLDADQKRYSLGASTVFQVVTDQQNLAAAESSESQALANYSHARIAYEQAMGRTLESNHVSIQEAQSGRVARTSILPAALPTPEQQQ